MNERTERMVGMLSEEWDNYIILCSRYEDGVTRTFGRWVGNTLANQQMMEDVLDAIVFDPDEEAEYGSEEETEG